MASYTIDINEQDKKGKRFIEFLKDYVNDNQFVELEKVPNKTTRLAIKEARKGEVHEVESVKALFDSI